MKLIFVILVGIFTLTDQQYLVGPTKTLPEHFPYHAYIKSDLYCLGALISTRFVVVNAICIETRRKAKVYLGTRDDPYYTLSGEGQVIHSGELITHPQFSKRYSDKLLVHNIGLVKLLEPALVTATVQPIRLPTRYDFPLQPGTHLNVTGYMDALFRSDILRFMTVRVRPQRECYQLYGHNLVRDDERCVEAIGDRRLDWPGPFAMNGKLVGLARVLSREIECVTPSPPCSPRDVFLNLEAYLDWIHDNTDVPRLESSPVLPPPIIIEQVRPPRIVVPPPRIVVSPPRILLPPPRILLPPPQIIRFPAFPIMPGGTLIINETESSIFGAAKKGAER